MIWGNVMIRRIIMIVAIAAFSLAISCDGTTGDDAAAADSMAAFEAFNNAFAPSGEAYTSNLYTAINQSIIGALTGVGSEFWVENPAIDAIVEVGLSGASPDSINALLSLIHAAVLNPWTLLDTTSLNGTHGCVSWSTGVDFDLQLVQAVKDLFNGKWWTLTVQTSLNECGDVAGQVTVEISGSRLGVVYQVHVYGDITVNSMPDETFALDVLYDLEECFNSWDGVDWSGTVNGYTISDAY